MMSAARVVTVTAIALLGLALALAVAFTMVARRTPATEGAVQLQGTTLANRPAPNFHLTDQFRRPVSLSAFRGRVVILTFFYTHCPDTCPLTAEKIRGVLRSLGKAGRRVAVLAVSTDPRGDTPTSARRFLVEHGSLHRWHFLLGSRARLKRVWSSYYVYAGSPRTAASTAAPAHSAIMYLIDARGRERVVLDDAEPPVQIAADLEILLGKRLSAPAPPVAPLSGDRAPEFALKSLAGQTLRLKRYVGKVVLLNFWATWCIPCRSELPRLQQVYSRYRQRGFVVLGVDQQEPVSAVGPFVKDRHVTYPIGLDEYGTVAYRYGIAGTPTSFLLDRHGTIRSIKVGAVDATALQRQVVLLLSAKA